MSAKLLSGKFVLRIPVELHQALKKEAVSSGISLNQACLNRLEKVSSQGHPAVEALKNFFGPSLVGVYLFGSTVRRQDSESSDIDILAVLDESVKIDRSLYKRWDERNSSLEEKLSFNFVHLPKPYPDTGALWLEIALEGFPLYDPQYVVHSQLIELRKAMINSPLKRSYSHGQPVWILNAK